MAGKDSQKGRSRLVHETWQNGEEGWRESDGETDGYIGVVEMKY